MHLKRRVTKLPNARKGYKEGGIYKYTYGASPDYNKVLRSKRSITDKFKDAFIIAFKNGEKINVNTAISEFKKNRNK